MKKSGIKSSGGINSVEENNLTENIINTVREPLLVLNKELRVLNASRSFYDFFKVGPDETIGKLIYDLGNKQWDIPKLRDLLETILPEKTTFDSYEVEHIFSTIGKRIMVLNARQIERDLGKEKIILLAIEDITERRLAEELLSEKNRMTSEYLDILLNYAHAPIIIWDSSLVIKRFNHEFEKLSGYSSTEVIDEKIEILFPEEKIDFTLELLEHHLKKENIEVVEIDIVTKDKGIKTVLWNSKNILDKEGNNIVATIAQDITERKQMENVVRESEVKSRTILEAIASGIIIVDPETHLVVEVNSEAIKLIGKTKEKIVGTVCHNFFCPAENGKNQVPYPEQLMDNTECELINEEGIKIPILKTVTQINLGGRRLLLENFTDITERKRTEDTLREEEYMLSQSQRLAHIGSWSWEMKGPFKWTDETYRIYGVSRETFVPAPESLINLIHPDDRPAMQNWFESKGPEKSIHTIDFRILLPDGSMRIINGTGDVLCDSENKPIYMAGTVQDITWRKQAEEELHKSENKYRSIFENIQDVYYETSMDGTILEISPSIKTVSKGQYQREDLIGKSMYEIYADPKDRDILIATMKQTGGVNDYEVPLKNKDGSFSFASISAKINFNADGQVHKIIGSLHDISDRKKAEKGLSESEKQYHDLFRNAPVGIYQSTPDDHFITVNNTLVRMLGYDSKDDLLKKTISNDIYFDPEERTKLLSKFKPFGSSFNHNLRWKKKNGDQIWISLTLHIEKDESGSTLYYEGFVEDITERKEAEEAVQKSKEFAENLIETANAIVVGLDLRGNITVFNKAAEAITGYTLSDLQDKNWFETIVPKKNYPRVWEEFDRLMTEGVVRNFENPILTKAGDERHVAWQNNEIVENGKITGTISFGIDITERKRTEKILREREATLDEAMKIARLGTWEYDVDRDQFKFNDQFYSLLHTTAEKEGGYFMSPGHYAQKFLHPDDVAIVVIETQKALETTDPNYISRLDHRIVYPDGKTGYLNVNIRIEKDLNGRTVKTFGVNQNITERKQTEEELKASQRLIAGIINTIPVRVFWKDRNLIYLGCNEIFARDAGFTDPKEIIGKDDSQMGWRDQAELYCADDREIIASGIPKVLFEESQTTPEGKTITILTSKIPLHNPEGEIIGLLGIYIDITERKRAEEEIAMLAHSLRSINECVSITDLEDKILFVNESFLKTYGYDQNELIGKHVSILRYPDNSPEYIENILPATLEGGWHGELWNKRKDGSKFLVHLTTTIIRDKEGKPLGLIGVASDITERKNTEKVLLKLKKAVDNSSEVIFLTDKEGILTFVNPSFSSTYGYSANEIIGKKTPRILKSEFIEADTYKQFWDTLISGNEVKGELINKRKNGTLITIESSASPIFDEHNNIIGFLGIQRDITLRKNAEKELIDAKEKAEESDRLKTAFLANMSHEIRTPMNGIMGFTELLKEPLLSGEEQQEYISVIEKSGQRMLTIINDIMSISKIESAQMEIAISDTNVYEQVKEVYDFFKPEADHKKLQISYKNSLTPKVAIIKTDREKVYAVLSNLVKNAIKYTHSGSIEFGYEKKNGNLEYFVKDSGIGIREEQKEIIFQRFRQGSESLTRNYEGAGLGLSISRAYVEMLGGKIWVERNCDLFPANGSPEEKGATFFFTIPVHPPIEAKIAASIGISDIVSVNQIGNLTILIAEDDLASTLLITKMVEIFTKKLLKVTTGKEAVKACRNNHDIDLVLMDINMPDMDGYEATAKIREFNKEVIIIAQTAYALYGDREKALEAGCNDYITKPIDASDLKKLINNYFN